MPGPSSAYRPEPEPEDSWRLARERLEAGTNRKLVVRLLQERGVDPRQAESIVNRVHVELARAGSLALLRARARRELVGGFVLVDLGLVALGLAAWSWWHRPAEMGPWFIVAPAALGAAILAVGISTLVRGFASRAAADKSERGQVPPPEPP